MIIVYLSVLGLYIFLYILSAKEPLPVSLTKEKKKFFFVRPAAYLYRKYGNRRVFSHGNAKKHLNLLNPGTGGKRDKEEAALRLFNVKRTGLTLLVIFIGDILALCLFVSGEMESIVSEGRYIYRNTYGTGSIEAKLQAQIKNSGKERTQEFAITVEEQRYEEALVRELAKEVKELLPEMILGDNTSGEEIRSNLELTEEAKGYPFHISWESSNYSLLYSDGSVINEEVQEQGEVVDLTAILTYGDYKEEYIFPVRILPPIYTEEELFKKKLYDLLINSEAKDRHKELVQLPEQMENATLSWEEKREDSSGYIFMLMGIGAVLIYLFQEKDLKERVEHRNRQMLLDYPQLVSKLTLYMGAGMTIRNAFRKIALDYRKERQDGGKYHYVYEEMLLICYELDSGISEAAAYEQFGKRCRLPQYTKFASLLVQNLKKGSNSLAEALRQESKNAFEERRNMARKLGEEAGTKLLLPMMLMLGIVMVLIIIPAYFSFSI